MATGRRHSAFGIVIAALPWVAIACGIALLARPVVTDWMYAREAEESISEIVSVYDDMDDPERLENLAQARAFNTRLSGGGDARDDIWDYDSQLTYRGTPASMMSWVDIPKIATRLPVFHYATDDVLSTGVGHLEWSALPVGGTSTRCIVSAHSGMQNTRMFDDIRSLEVGDTFVFWTLSEPYCYRVRDIQVIYPDEVDKLAVEEGRDLATLVTCTPFGVNTHRLCVTGERCDYVEQEASTTPVEAYVNRRTMPLLAGVALLSALFVFLVVVFARRAMRRRAR